MLCGRQLLLISGAESLSEVSGELGRLAFILYFSEHRAKRGKTSLGRIFTQRHHLILLCNPRVKSSYLLTPPRPGWLGAGEAAWAPHPRPQWPGTQPPPSSSGLRYPQIPGVPASEWCRHTYVNTGRGNYLSIIPVVKEFSAIVWLETILTPFEFLFVAVALLL